MKTIIMRAVLLVGLILVLSFSCRKSPKSPATCEFSNAGNDFFTIVDNNDSPERAFNIFCKKVDVFGLKVYATSGVTDAELLHCANVLAQYLDNDEDGTIDNQLVLDKMLENKSCMTLFSKERSVEQRRFFNSLQGDEYVTQDLYGTETFPGWNLTSPFDATLEEVLHWSPLADIREFIHRFLENSRALRSPTPWIWQGEDNLRIFPVLIQLEHGIAMTTELANTIAR